MKIKALSIRQPYAAMIVAGWKDVENRTRSTTHRGLLAIHAGKKKMTRADWAWFCELCADYEVETPPEEHFVYGAIIGVANVVDCVQASDSPWFEGPYGFVIDTSCEIEPVFMNGRLGLFEVDLDMEVAALDLLPVIEWVED